MVFAPSNCAAEAGEFLVRVADATNHPIPTAVAQLVAVGSLQVAPAAGVTDESGYARLKVEGAGSYALIVSLEAFRPLVRVVTLGTTRGSCGVVTLEVVGNASNAP